MEMKLKHFACLMGLLVTVQGLGCASSCHRYGDCCDVNCRYCEPGPMPYPHYSGCVCHSKQGARYLSSPSHGMSRTDSNTTDVIVTGEHESTSEIDKPASPVEREPVYDISQRPYDD